VPTTPFSPYPGPFRWGAFTFYGPQATLVGTVIDCGSSRVFWWWQKERGSPFRLHFPPQEQCSRAQVPSRPLLSPLKRQPPSPLDRWKSRSASPPPALMRNRRLCASPPIPPLLVFPLIPKNLWSTWRGRYLIPVFCGPLHEFCVCSLGRSPPRGGGMARKPPSRRNRALLPFRSRPFLGFKFLLFGRSTVRVPFGELSVFLLSGNWRIRILRRGRHRASHLSSPPLPDREVPLREILPQPGPCTGAAKWTVFPNPNAFFFWSKPVFPSLAIRLWISTTTVLGRALSPLADPFSSTKKGDRPLLSRYGPSMSTPLRCDISGRPYCSSLFQLSLLRSGSAQGLRGGFTRSTSCNTRALRGKPPPGRASLPSPSGHSSRQKVACARLPGRPPSRREGLRAFPGRCFNQDPPPTRRLFPRRRVFHVALSPRPFLRRCGR